MMVILTDISDQPHSPKTYNYDVFLSFRCTDTRNNFTDHLLNSLQQANIETFFDDTEIQTGDFLKPELDHAIKTSRASIIVLSKDYASSMWCLDELALIMDQRINSEHIVYPVFYNVKPSDVRKQRSGFGVAMGKYKKSIKTVSNAKEKRGLRERIERWKKALTDVADMKGVEALGRETLLIERIVEDISSRLDLHKRSKIPKLIGMESSLRIITSFLYNGSSNENAAEFLTIWGMAGIGKTYLADYIFKLHYHEFERSCFVEDIEKKCMPLNGLLDLQKQILKDIKVKNWMGINDVNVGTLKIEKSLFGKRTLLVLDGISKFEQLDVLVGTKGLHPGSKVIITSKNELLTEKCRLFDTQVPPKHTKHLLQGLNNKESLQLLSWHAFGRNEPKEGDIKKSMKVIRYCKGHPLALKVLGGSLRGEDAAWEDILESLEKETNSDIINVLKVSFDTLPSEKDKELFKHIACLFVGEDRKYTEDILKACGICKSSGIKILINRCLLTVESSEKLTMHQLLQDMGRDIVRQESPKKPWKRSILWHHEECLDVLQNRQGTTMIQGLALDMRTSENDTSKESVVWWLFDWVSGMCSSFRRTKGDFETLALSEMRNLRLLQLNYVQLSGSYKDFPPGLRWLCLQGFPLSYIPSDLQMENIVALDMSNSKLLHIWKKPKKLRSLKFLNLNDCHELVSVGDFSGFPLLERLTLVRCTSLVEVCESVGDYCEKLEVLDLTQCNKLKKLPRSIGKLKNLKQLSIDGCSNLTEIPCEIKDMHSLEILQANDINIESHVSSSAIVEALPKSIKTVLMSMPSSLVTLSLRNNKLSNEFFPKDFSSLSMLKNLNLEGNPIVTLPDCVRSLSRLDNLNLNDCQILKTVLYVPNTVTHLATYDCFSLEQITFHPEKSAPPDINYYDAYSLIEIQDKFKLQVLADIPEEVLCSLGWTNVNYLKHYKVSMTDCDGCYHTTGKLLPAQMLYEHGIFSTYLEGQEVPKWFTYRSNGSSVTLQSSQKNGKIRGLNLCIVSALSSLAEVGPSRIEIRNLTKNCSWTYQPLIYVIPEANEEVIVWLSHWMFGNNDFQEGDEVGVHVSAKFDYGHDGFDLCYGGEGPDYANVREYGISLVYDDDDEDINQDEDPLGYYKSWKHIIGGDLSAAESSTSNYLLRQRRGVFK